LAALGVSQKKQGKKAVVGHWMGAIDRRWLAAPAVRDIANDGNTLPRQLDVTRDAGGVMLDPVEVQGNSVHFE